MYPRPLANYNETGHTIKGIEMQKALNNWLNNNPNASYSDRLTAQSVRDDLADALNTK
jgi:hypothetical protein